MQNNIACENVKKELMVEEFQALQWNTPQLQSTNRFIYVKQRVPDFTPVESGSQKVLVNPHFRSTSKVFVNPNFPGQIHSQPAIHVNPHMRNTLIPQIDHQVSGGTYESQNLTCHIPFLHGTRIHVNPNAKSVQIPTLVVSQTVHINPKFTNGTAIAKNALSTVRTIPTHEPKENVPAQTLNKVVVLSKTKLIRTAHISNIKKLKRRNSVKSKYKIIKTGLSPKRTLTIGNINHTSLSISKNKFKIDKRRKSSSCSKTQKKYIYDNKLVTTSDLIKSRIVKKNSPSKNVRNLSIINIGGIVYRKSGNSIRRASIPRAKDINKTVLNIQCTADNRTIYKIPPKTVKFDTKNKIVKKFKIIRKQCLKKTKEAKISPRKLRKCNVPCPSYQKYGICKGEANGKCFWKHDPDQIALCTRFLQGACIKEKCLLSHNVSPEKMPTCKYYLEGSCSKESCPYLHVKISPKAQVCKDFLEGFCKKAAECGERHQYLCPDYEKYGECLKQRCPYPHGKMVRTYLINKNKFAKKCSDVDIKTKKSRDNLPPNSEPKISEKGEVNEKRRYYTEKRSQSEETACGSSDLKVNHTENPNVEEINLRTFIGLQSRPRLGILPSYIPFGDS